MEYLIYLTYHRERAEKMRKKKSLVRKIWRNIIIFLIFILVIIYCTNILNKILWENTNEMGLSLVKNYSSTEEQSINTFETLLNICTNYIADRERTGISLAELKEELYPFMNGLTDVYGKDNIHIYGRTFDGTELVSNIPEIEAMTDYDVTNTKWYQGAAVSNGETYISPVYTDAITGFPVVTMCKFIPNTGSFLAIDIKPSCFELNSQDKALPNKASYYLIDQEGKLIYYLSSYNYKKEEFQDLVNDYRENAVCETTNHVLENVKDSDGVVQNVFFHHMDNGWTGILTIPKDEILSGSDMFQNISFVLIGVGIFMNTLYIKML